MSQQYHRIVHSVQEVTAFARLWLPELRAGSDEAFVIALLVRNKDLRDGDVKTGRRLFQRRVITSSDPVDLVCELQRYEPPVGTYTVTLKKKNVEAKVGEPDAAAQRAVVVLNDHRLAVYVTLEPRSMCAAFQRLIGEYLGHMASVSPNSACRDGKSSVSAVTHGGGDDNDDSDEDDKADPASAAPSLLGGPRGLRSVQRLPRRLVHLLHASRAPKSPTSSSASAPAFVHLDIDTKEGDRLQMLRKCLTENGGAVARKQTALRSGPWSKPTMGST